MKPRLIDGGNFKDHRGEIKFNNDFDASEVKRIYMISNSPENPIRGWQGHKIEQRWFTATEGSVKITLRKVKNWEYPVVFDSEYNFTLSSKNMDVLHVPSGYVSKIKNLTDNASLIAMSDYSLGEIEDEYKFDLSDLK